MCRNAEGRVPEVRAQPGETVSGPPVRWWTFPAPDV